MAGRALVGRDGRPQGGRRCLATNPKPTLDLGQTVMRRLCVCCHWAPGSTALGSKTAIDTFRKIRIIRTRA